MEDAWPPLAFESWRDTAMTLQLWTQVVGKLRLAHTPWLNHSWQVPLYVTARGLATSPIPNGHELVDMEFDFLAHRLVGRSSNGAVAELALAPMPVADFYRATLALAGRLGLKADINPFPCELPGAIAFADDQLHRSYDADAVHRFWRALLQADRLLKHFRTAFLGKASPVHFFWGSFDLAVTRFSGRRAPVTCRRHHASSAKPSGRTWGKAGTPTATGSPGRRDWQFWMAIWRRFLTALSSSILNTWAQ